MLMVGVCVCCFSYITELDLLTKQLLLGKQGLLLTRLRDATPDGGTLYIVARW
jgi:hypothetical protein